MRSHSFVRLIHKLLSPWISLCPTQSRAIWPKAPMSKRALDSEEVRAGGTLLQGSHGWHPGPDRGSRAALRLTWDARLALQAEPGPTPPHPGAEAQGHELARLRREPAPARQLDGLVFGRGGRGVEGGAAHEPRWTALVFGARHPHRS